MSHSCGSAVNPVKRALGPSRQMLHRGLSLDSRTRTVCWWNRHSSTYRALELHAGLLCWVPKGDGQWGWQGFIAGSVRLPGWTVCKDVSLVPRQGTTHTHRTGGASMWPHQTVEDLITPISKTQSHYMFLFFLPSSIRPSLWMSKVFCKNYRIDFRETCWRDGGHVSVKILKLIPITIKNLVFFKDTAR